MDLPNFTSFKKETERLRRNELSVMLMVTEAIEQNSHLDFTSENMSLLKKTCEALLYVVHRIETNEDAINFHFIDGYRVQDGHIYIYPNMEFHQYWLRVLNEKREQQRKLVELEQEENEQDVSLHG